MPSLLLEVKGDFFIRLTCKWPAQCSLPYFSKRLFFCFRANSTFPSTKQLKLYHSRAFPEGFHISVWVKAWGCTPATKITSTTTLLMRTSIIWRSGRRIAGMIFRRVKVSVVPIKTNVDCWEKWMIEQDIESARLILMLGYRSSVKVCTHRNTLSQ